MVRTKKPVLWTALHHTRSLMALSMVGDGRMVLPMFSSPFACEAWIMTVGLEQHFCSPPLWPPHLKELLEFALDNGFEGYALNPPTTTKLPMQVAEIEDLIEQVEARL